MKHLTVRGRRKEIGSLLLKVIQRYAHRQENERPGLAKEPPLSLHGRPPTSNNRGGRS